MTISYAPKQTALRRTFASLRSAKAFLTYLLLIATVAGGGLFLRPAFAQDRSDTTASNERVVTVYNNGEKQTYVTTATTVEAALERRGIDLGDDDVTEPARNEKLIASDYHINVYRARPVLVIDGMSRTTIMTAAKTAENVARDAGIELYAEDIGDIERVDDILSDGMVAQKVIIDRSTPIKFNLYGRTADVRTQADTVGGLLKEKGVTIGKNDGVSLPTETPITAGMQLQVWRDGKQTVTEELAIPFPVEQIKDMDQPPTFKQVTTAGTPGKKSVTYEIEMRNGKEISRKEIQTVVVTEPKKQVERVGGKLPTPTNPTENQALGKQMMLAAGYGEDQWPCLYNLWMKESGWRVNAGNPSSGAYGIPQALPASKMANSGPDYMNNAATQITWGLGYIKGRYGSPCGAWSSFQAKGWY